MNENSMNNAVTMRPDANASLGRIDQYELIRELGGGGFGCVYLARDTVAGIEVAVKGLPPLVRLNKEELENVRKNFALVSRLHHPNIAAALHLQKVEKAFYDDKSDAEKLRVFKGDTLVVMQYAPGVTLSQWRKQFPEGKVPLDKALEITRQIASALDYAHKERILHRDIKPANVMIETGPDGKIVARVLDFGLAAEIRSSMSRVSQSITDTSGTRPYMAPEQWLGEEQGKETDQYALAVLFNELVTGKVPFVSVFDTGDPVLMMNVVGNRAFNPSSDLPKPIRFALTKALAKKREDRFASCSEFIDALVGRMSGGRASSRAAAILTAIVALCLAFGGVWYWQDAKAKEEARIVAEQKAEAERKASEEARRIAEEKAKKEKAETERKQKEEAARIAAEKDAERKAELEVFRLSSKAQSAHDLIDGESSEIKEFFASEIRAIENDRRAGDDAKANSKYVIATNFYAQALMSATALKVSVANYRECKELLPKIERAKERADEVKASETLPSGYKTAQVAHNAALDALKQKRFDECMKKGKEAETLFISLRADVIRAVLDIAEGHKNANRLNECLKEVEKILNWDADNERALLIRKELDSYIKSDYTKKALSAFQAQIPRWKEGFEYAQKGDMSDARIQYYIGVCYFWGYGTFSIDRKKSWIFLTKSANQGFIKALKHLSEYCMTWDYDDMTKKEWFPKLLSIWKKEAAANKSEAQYELGMYYLQGNRYGITILNEPKNEELAVEYLKKSAENKNRSAISQMAQLYESGKCGLVKDINKSEKLRKQYVSSLMQSADNGDVEAQQRLAYCFKSGFVVSTNLFEAFSWYHKAALAGDYGCQWKIGFAYGEGNGVPANFLEAEKWLSKAAEQTPHLADKVARFYSKDSSWSPKWFIKDEDKSLYWYRNAANRGYVPAMEKLAQMYEKGKGVAKDVEEAKRLYKKALMAKNEVVAIVMEGRSRNKVKKNEERKRERKGVQLWSGGPYWAATNIGAEKPWECGYYFWWGDTIGYKRVNDCWVKSDAAADSAVSRFGFRATTYNKSNMELKKEGLVTDELVLAMAYDAANVHWGGSWRMPTKQEFEDLKDRCEWKWMTREGVNGYCIRGKGAYASFSIFLPAAGYAWSTYFSDYSSKGYYWSSESKLYEDESYRLTFDSDNLPSVFYTFRDRGYSIRPVQGVAK